MQPSPNATLALILAILATLFGCDRTRQATEPTKKILAATRKINIGDPITTRNTEFKKFPKRLIPASAVNDLKDVDGLYARQSIFPGEMVLTPKLARKEFFESS